MTEHIRNYRSTADSHHAAFLLLKLKALVEDEVRGTELPSCRRLLPRIIPEESCASPNSAFPDDCDDSVESLLHFQGRIRTVSVSSHENSAHSPLGMSLILSESASLRKDLPPFPEQLLISSSVPRVIKTLPSSKLVGTTAEAPLRGVIKRKFSWKSYPELEAYLLKHREEYLQYSSQLNYTAEQKQYNNKLTKGLLDLASSQGYVFEEFTFSAIRDRIRCYYKSFVQSVKKKKRRIQT